MTRPPLPALTIETTSPAHITAVCAGRVAPLGPKSVPSGFVKHRGDGIAHVGMLGLQGDEQADLTVHGGPDKAVYAYALSNYAAWLRDFPQHAGLLIPGGLGENLTIDGLCEATVCVGDIVRIGTTTLQVTQPRQPCFKLALRFNNPRLPQAMMRNGACGWYYRVLVPGSLAAGDTLTLQARPNPSWTIARFHRLIAGRSAALGDLAELAELEGLAAAWRSIALKAVSERMSATSAFSGSME